MKDLHELKMMHFHKALELFRKDLDFFGELFESKKYELLAFRKFRYNGKVKILSGRGCDNCADLNGRIFTIDEAIKLMPIPNSNCNHETNASGKGWCRCSYVSGDDPKEQIKQIDKDFRENLAKLINGK